MPLFSYVAGAVTLLAGALIVLQPDSPAPSAGSLSSWAAWLFQSHPSPPYAHLPLFGMPADVRLRPSHSLTGSGLHRRYRLELEITSERERELAACRVLAEWVLDRDFIVDQWLLHRHSPVQWTFTGQSVDLEVPAYSPRAAPFTLTAALPLRRGMTGAQPGQQIRQYIEIPDIVPRYQMPRASGGRDRGESTQLWINPPRLSLDCQQPSDASESGLSSSSLLMKVEEGGARFKAIPLYVPVATAVPLINHATYSLVSASLLYLLYHLYKA